MLIRFDERFVCHLWGPRGCGKSLALAELIWRIDMPFDEIAVYGPTGPAIRSLRRLIGSAWPDLDPQLDLFPPELSGTPVKAMRQHTAIAGDITPLRYDEIIEDYLLLIARANELDIAQPHNANWLMGLKRWVVGAINADLTCRLDRMPLPRNAYLHAVANHVAACKGDQLDLADLMHGDYYQSPQVKLLMFDDISRHDQRVVRRFFPNASIVTTHVETHQAALSMRLTSWRSGP